MYVCKGRVHKKNRKKTDKCQFLCMYVGRKSEMSVFFVIFPAEVIYRQFQWSLRKKNRKMSVFMEYVCMYVVSFFCFFCAPFPRPKLTFVSFFCFFLRTLHLFSSTVKLRVPPLLYFSNIANCISAKLRTVFLTTNTYISAWVTRPERPKGAKDEVKDARRAQSRPEGPPTRRGPMGA